MAYRVRTETRPAGNGAEASVYVLEETSGIECAEIWPALGFNCYRWRAGCGGRPVEMLYADPQLFESGRPTRSGIPILFPFPNRIRDGRFAWEGRKFELPPNDPSGKNAIHGFACRKPWRVTGQGADDSSAWLSGQFQTSRDAPEALELWPADHQIEITYRLGPGRLSIQARVDNPDRRTLPFGLGFHPYFRVGDADACKVAAPAQAYWELRDSLPTGVRYAVDPSRALNRLRPFSSLTLDDVLTGLPYSGSSETGGVHSRGSVVRNAEQAELRLLAGAAFRELVVFTPPHRQAICLEPYTCTTDAINLQQQGIDAGLLLLEPGKRWTADVELGALKVDGTGH